MYKMRKLLSLLLITSICICTLASCGSSDDAVSTQEGTDKVATVTETDAEKAPEVTPSPTPSPTPTPIDLKDEVYETRYPSDAGALQVCGTQLCDSEGNPVQLRGVSTHGIQWFPEYINEDLFKELKEEWGVNAVRLCLYTEESEGYCEDGDKEALKDLICQGVEYAKEADLYAIVDWHSMQDGDPTTHEDEALLFFEEISERLSGYDNVLYEICNEPNTVVWKVIKEYALNVIPKIRANDPDAVVIVGTPIYCKAPTEAKKDPITEYDNVMYSLHFYAASHKESIQVEVKGMADAGLPLFVSEFGICSNTGTGSLDIESGDTWMDLLDEYGVSYMIWQLSNKHESSSLIKEECTKTSGFTEDDLTEHALWYREHLKR